MSSTRVSHLLELKLKPRVVYFRLAFGSRYLMGFTLYSRSFIAGNQCKSSVLASNQGIEHFAVVL